MNRAAAQKGFTLLEMLTVVTLLGIFAAIAVPSFTSLVNQTRTSSVADNVFGLIMHARSEAVLRRSTVSVCLSELQLVSVLGSCAAPSAQLRKISISPAQVAVQASQANISYFADGTTNGDVTSRVSYLVCHGLDTAYGYKIDIQRNGVTRRYAKGKADETGNALTTCQP